VEAAHHIGSVSCAVERHCNGWPASCKYAQGMMGQTGVRAAVLALSWVVTLGASGCVQQHSPAARNASGTRAEELRDDAPTRCVDAERETRVLDLASSSGHLAPQKIRDVMQRQQASVSDCFEASLASQPNFKGTVTLVFAIEADGSVSQTSVLQSDFADCEVTQCLRAHLASLSFPAPEGGAVLVQYPISVKSQPLSGSVTASSR
ncbi:MAG: hypothetical protein RL033_277, partial [Pseudomonadota bacterium]